MSRDISVALLEASCELRDGDIKTDVDVDVTVTQEGHSITIDVSNLPFGRFKIFLREMLGDPVFLDQILEVIQEIDPATTESQTCHT